MTKSKGKSKKQSPLSGTGRSRFLRKVLKKNQTLPWKQMNNTTYKYLSLLLQGAEMELLDQTQKSFDGNNVAAVQMLNQIKKQTMQKLKGIYTPDAKWQNVDSQNLKNWLQKARNRNEALESLCEKEEREAERMENEMEALPSSNLSVR